MRRLYSRRDAAIFLGAAIFAGSVSVAAPLTAQASAASIGLAPSVPSAHPTSATAANLSAPTRSTAAVGSAPTRSTSTPTRSAAAVASAPIRGTAAVAPVVYAIDPSSGPTLGGSRIYIYGKGFTGATNVQFGSANVGCGGNTGGFSVISDILISLTAPAGTLGTVDVIVTGPGGSSLTGVPDRFTYVSPSAPAVYGISPSSGPTTGGTDVTINGKGFTNATKAVFGTVPVFGFAISDTAYEVFSPPRVAGTVDVTVVDSSGTSPVTNADKFTFVAAGGPVVRAVSPNSSTAAGGAVVLLIGSGFKTATAVHFGTTAIVTGNFSVFDDSHISVMAPSGAPATTVDVTVTNSVGTSAVINADKFSYLAPGPPVLNAVVFGSQGPAIGGTLVELTGSGFSGATAVKFGANSGTGLLLLDDGDLTVTSPPGAVGPVDITIITPVGTSALSAADRFTYAATPVPVVYGVSPSTGSTGGQNAVSIFGAGFTGTTGVHFGGHLATTNLTVSGDGSISVTAPAGAIGSVDVTVTTPGGTSALTAGDKYTYVAPGPPVVNTVSPGHGAPAGGDSIEVLGSGFTGVTAVHFGAVAAPFFSAFTDSQMSVTTPAGTNGTTVDITVTTPVATSVISAADRFSFITPPVPVVTAVSPSSGPTAGGTAVWISGTGLSGASSVTFGTVIAFDFKPMGDNLIQVFGSPSGSLGVVDVTVTTGGGSSALSSADHFTYTAAPVPAVTAVGPSSGPASGGSTVYISGRGLSGVSTVNFGLSAAAFFVNDDRLITATSPAGTASTTVDVTVVGPGGTSPVTTNDQFSYTASGPPVAPSISAVSPNNGPPNGGTTVYITGSHFTGITQVNFGTSTVFGWNFFSDDLISVTSPSGTSGATVDITVTTSAGTSPTSAADQFTYGPAILPTVTVVSPATGPSGGGTTVYITGSHLNGVTGVSFGSAAGFVQVISDNLVQAVSPAQGANPTTVDVTVTSSVGTSATSANDQFVFGGPSPSSLQVNGVSPNLGTTTGLAAGGDNIEIVGLGFTGATAVTFGTSPAPSFFVNSDTQIFTSSPGGAAGAVDVTVTVGGSTSAKTKADKFTFNAPGPPVVNAIAPNHGSSTGGISVTIYGSGLSGSSTVQFGTSAPLAANSFDDSQVTVQSPAGTAGTSVDVTVTTSVGTSATSPADLFKYQTPGQPVVDAVDPSSGSTLGGTSVSIWGSGFSGATVVLFGSTRVFIGFATDTQIYLTSPPGTAGTVDVTVTTPGGTSATSNADKFTLLLPGGPVVNAVSPNRGGTSGDRTVQIFGSGLSGTTAVSFGTSPASTVFSSSDTEVDAISPPGVVGTVDVTVTTPSGTSTPGASDKYTYFVAPAPTVTAVSPNSGAAGSSVYITGTGLSEATSVFFGNACPVFSLSGADTYLQVFAPAGPTGTVDVTVVSPDGTSAISTNDRFTYTGVPIPTVTFVAPASGPAGGGTLVYITGTGLTAVTAVTFGSVSVPNTCQFFGFCGFLALDDGLIEAQSPAGAVGTVDVSVTSPVGTSSITAADRFTYTSTVPSVAVVSPSSGPSGGGDVAYVTGSGFLGATQVNFGSTVVEPCLSFFFGAGVGPRTATGAGASPTIQAANPASSPRTPILTRLPVHDPRHASQTPRFATVVVPSVPHRLVSGTARPPVPRRSAIPQAAMPQAAIPQAGTPQAASGLGIPTCSTSGFVALTDNVIELIAVPSGSIGTVDVTVTSAGGTSATSGADHYAYVATPAPVVSAVSPNGGTSGGGSTVYISGSHLRNASTAQFGGVAATLVGDPYLDNPFYFGNASPSDSVIVALSPPGAGPSSVDVTATTAGGTSAQTAADQYTYTSAPTPTVGATGPTTGPAGTTVFITGSGFLGASAVDFGTAAGTGFDVIDDRLIRATAPNGSGTVHVTVVTPGGTSSTSSADQFTYTASPSPAVTAVEPGSGPSGTVTYITGSGVTGASTVSFGGTNATRFAILSDSLVEARSPAGAGTVDVTVTAPGGTSAVTSADTYSYVASTNTSTSLASAPNPSVVGQAIQFTAIVTATTGQATPAGSVSLLEGATTLATGPLDSSGTVNFTVSSLAVGTHTITASYAGGGFAPSISAPLTQTVSKGDTTTALSSSANASVVGQSVTYTATVTRTAPASGTGTGTVSFQDGGVSIAGCGAKAAAVPGTTTCVVSYAIPGSHTITAIYGGDANFNPSTSLNLTQTINTDSTTTSLSSSVNPSVSGQTITYAATVTANLPGAGTPTGTINFQDGGVGIAGCGAQALVAGTASCSVTYAGVGSHSIVAIYSGDANFNTSISPNLTQTVGQDATTVALASSVNPSVVGESVTYTATVTANAPGSGIPAGTVNFQDGGISIAGCGAQALVAGGATCTVTSAGVGGHTISGVYSGDANFNPSTSPNLTQTVNMGSAGTALGSSANPAVVGQNVTYTAMVTATAPASGTRTGTIDFQDGGVDIAGCTAQPLTAADTATCVVSYAAAGTHAIVAIYSGDANFTASTSPNLTQIVNRGDTTTALASSANPSVVGQNVMYTATVTATAPASGTETGTVTFQDGGVSIAGCPAQPVASGTATCVVSYAVASSRTISATYSGDANFNPSTSPNLTQTVNKGNTITAVTSSINPSVSGQSVTYTATVSVAAPAFGAPTGSVTFQDGGATIGVASLDSTGSAALTVSSLGVGLHPITAIFGGDARFDTSTSLPLSEMVNQASTLTALTTDVNPQVQGQPVTFSAHVTAVTPGAGRPSGSVTFQEGPTSLGTATVDATGTAQLILSTLAVGSHSVIATYGGDANFTGSTSLAVVEVVNAAMSTTVLVDSSANPAVFGQAINFTANVVPASPTAFVPSGSVTYLDGSTVLAKVNLDATGQAVLTLSTLANGSHSITVAYGGDSIFGGGTSQALTQVVNQDGTTTAATADSNPAAENQTVTLTAAVAPVAPGAGAPTGTVTFKDGATSLGSVAVDAGSAKLAISTLAIGNHTIVASYSGDSNFLPSVSPGYIEAVLPATLTTLTSAPNPSVVGQAVTFTAIVAFKTGQGTPAGTVSLSEGSTTLATGTLNSSGIAQFTISTLAAGSHSLTASYAGQATASASVSAQLTQVVKGSTSVVIASSVNPSVGGQSITITATVTSTSASSTAPSGFVTFDDGTSPLGSGHLDSTGKATFTTAALALGTHSITANYPGDSIFAASTSATLTQTVVASLKLAITSPPVSLTAGASSGLITVQLQNQSSTPVPAPSGGLSLVLKTASPTGRFRDASDSTTITTSVIAGGSSSVQFRYRDTFAGTASITVSTQNAAAATPATQSETVIPAGPDHLGLRPATATVAPGSSKTYSAEGFDVYGNDIGDVTLATQFSVGPDGNCIGSNCTIPTTGTHTVTGTDGTAIGTALLIGDPGPVPTLSVSNASGIASHTVTFNVGGSDADGDPLTYTINYGDGTRASGSLPSAPLTHLYTSACPNCAVVLSVSDGITQPVPFAVATVNIAPNQPLVAKPGDPATITLGQAAHLDGSNSSPAPPGIDSYTWNFGDGTSAIGPVQDHVYPGPAPKTWTATMTITGGGSSASATVNVTVLPAPSTSGLNINVTGDGSALAGASVVIEDANNHVFNAVDKGGGVYTINGLPDGSYTVFGYKSGFVPNTASATISGGTGSTSLALTSGAVATTNLTATRLTAAQAIALGIDITAPGNQNVYQFELHLAFIPGADLIISGVATGTGFYSVGAGGGGGGCSISCGMIIGSAGGFTVVGTVGEINSDNPTIIWMIIPGKAQWLKEMFDVRILVTNLAPTPFTLSQGSATLNLPTGLSLAQLQPGLPAQQLTKPISDIPGQSSQGTDWLIRGDTEGLYQLSADYRAVLDPVGAPILLHAQTVDPIHIWGASALRMTFDADDVAYAGFPYHIRVSLTNVADVPVYNPLVELLPLEGDPNRNYAFQPREQYDQGTDEILPGGTFQSRDYIVAPNFNGTLDLSRSFVAPVGGNISSLSSVITSQPAPSPFSVPTDSARIETNGVLVSWKPVTGAQGYQVFATTDYAHDFPFAYLAHVSGSQTSTLLPPGSYPLLAISTLLIGADGQIHNVLSNPLVRPVDDRVTPPENPGDGNASEPNLCPAQGAGGDPCNTASGDFDVTYNDFSIPGRGLPFDLSRTYSSLFSGADGPFGFGWTGNDRMSLAQDASGNVTISQENGAQVPFFELPDGSYIAPPRVDATLAHNADGTWRFTRRARPTYTFNASGQLTREVDLNGYATTLAYNAQGQLRTVSDPAGRTLTFTYIASHVATATDPLGRVFQYAYDTYGNLINVTDPEAGATQFTYDSAHHLLTIRRPNQAPGVPGSTGAVLINSYDNQSRLMAQTDQLGRTTTFAYSGDNFSTTGGTTTIADPKGNVTVDTYVNGLRVSETRGYGTPQAATSTYAYDPDRLGMLSTTDPNGHTSTASYDAAGNLLTRTDPLGRKTVNTYDALNDLLTTTDPLGVTTTMTYDSDGNFLQTSRPLVGTSQLQVTTYKYGDASHPGDVTAVTDPTGNVSRYAYDSDGNLVASTDPAGDRTTYIYNAIGWRVSATSPKGNLSGANPATFTTIYGYDSLGRMIRVTDPLGDRIAYSYDPDSNQIDATDPNGNTTTYSYDAADEKTAIHRPDGTVTQTTYWPDGTIKDQIDGAGAATHYQYDSLRRLTGVTDPLHRVTTYGYDAAGNLTSITNASGQITTKTYDAADELTGISYSDGNTSAVSNILYDAEGQRIGLTDGSGVWSWTWDSLHRLTKVTEGSNGSVVYTYDLRDLVKTIIYPGSLIASHGYDAAGRLASVSDWLGNTTNFAYDANSNLIRETPPPATVITDTNAYDAADRLSSITDSSAGSILFSAQYTRDPNGQLTADSSVKGSAHKYAYNPLNQLCYAAPRTSAPCSNPPSSSVDYAYNAADDLVINEGITQAFDAANELCWTAGSAGTSSTCTTPPSVATIYGYNARGDRTGIAPSSGVSTTLAYDEADRLTSYTQGATAATYSYNADGLRMAKIVNGSKTAFVWDEAGGLPLLLDDGSTAYLYGPGGQPVEEISGTNAMWLHHDQLGSTRLVTGPRGQKIGGYTFDPYGRLLKASGKIVTPLKYAGQYQDAESGLYYLRSRYYDPSSAQFITKDPLNPRTRHPYVYVADDPLNAVDATGALGLSDVTNAVGDAWNWLSTGWCIRDPFAGFDNGNGGCKTALSSTQAGRALDVVALIPLPGVGAVAGGLGALIDQGFCDRGNQVACVAAATGLASGYESLIPPLKISAELGGVATLGLDLYSASSGQQTANSCPTSASLGVSSLNVPGGASASLGVSSLEVSGGATSGGTSSLSVSGGATSGGTSSLSVP